MDELKLYEHFKKYIKENNYEGHIDSYGNRIETFLIIDDCAITFCFNNDNELQGCWLVS